MYFVFFVPIFAVKKYIFNELVDLWLTTITKDPTLNKTCESDKNNHTLFEA
jgi:hypothetical protein